MASADFVSGLSAPHTPSCKDTSDAARSEGGCFVGNLGRYVQVRTLLTRLKPTWLWNQNGSVWQLCHIPIFSVMPANHFCGWQTGVLGQGTFGMVIRATDPETDPPTDVAIKLLPRGNFIKNFKTYVKREILHQSSLKHPFIVSLREVRWLLLVSIRIIVGLQLSDPRLSQICYTDLVWAMTGVSHPHPPCHCHGICPGRRPVPVCVAASADMPAIRAKGTMDLPAIDHRLGLLP